MAPDEAPPITVPRALATSLDRYFGPQWARRLPRLTSQQLRSWDLRPTAPPMHGAVALVVPVRCPDGTPAMLKIQPVDDESRGEPQALRVWAGRDAVRLLDHDPRTGALLLEALDPARSLETVEITHALTVIGQLLGVLSAHRAPRGMRTLADITRELVERAGRLAPRLPSQGERDHLAWLASHARQMATEPGDRLLHWDLHYKNVLAPAHGADRPPWLAIDPKPLAGDPGFELLPALHNRWPEAEATGDPGRETLRRLDILAESAGIERDRARDWTLVRVLQECVWALQDGHGRLPRMHTIISRALTSR